MSLSYLLVPPTKDTLNSWQFEHMMAHRGLFGAMSEAPTITVIPPQGGGAGPESQYVIGGGFTRFSALPYLLDPTFDVGMWHLDNSKAHSDFQEALPAYFGFVDVEASLGPTDPGFTSMHFSDPSLLGWWTFSNHQQHLVAQSVLPEILDYPFF